MSENKNLNSSNSTHTNKKYKKYIRLIIYVFLILLLVFILASLYIKVKSFIDNQSTDYKDTPNTAISKDNEKSTLSEKVDSINTSNLEDLMQNQQKFQKEVYQKFDELNDKINSLNSNNSKHITESKTIVIDNKNNNTSPKIDNCKELNTVFNLIMDLNSEFPFLTGLDAVKNSGLLKNKLPEMNELYEVSSKGIPTSYSLAIAFEELQPNIKREIYSEGKGWLNKAKYYLSFFVVIQKESNLTYNDNTLDGNLSKIKQMLIENKPEYALKILDENNLSQLKVLDSWYKDLTYRVKANALILKLKQYFLNS